MKDLSAKRVLGDLAVRGSETADLIEALAGRTRRRRHDVVSPSPERVAVVVAVACRRGRPIAGGLRWASRSPPSAPSAPFPR
jgi:hypothetical protein